MKKGDSKKLMKGLVGKRNPMGFEVNFMPTKEDLGYEPEGEDSLIPFVFTSIDIGYIINPQLLISR